MEVKSWKQQQADRTHEQLLESARVLFVEKGYAATSLEEMTRGALYHHFNDKRARFDAVVARSIEEMGDRVAAVSKARVARRRSPSATLTATWRPWRFYSTSSATRPPAVGC
jgi:AcrR family transcriptional regulator